MDLRGLLSSAAAPPEPVGYWFWRLAVLDRSPSPQPVSSGSAQIPGLGDALLAEGHRLGITVKAGQPEPLQDAIFRAEPGWLGTITIRQRPTSPVDGCMLISREFIYARQRTGLSRGPSSGGGTPDRIRLSDARRLGDGSG